MLCVRFLLKLFFSLRKSKRGINDKWIAITLHALTHAGGSKNKKISCFFCRLYSERKFFLITSCEKLSKCEKFFTIAYIFRGMRCVCDDKETSSRMGWSMQKNFSLKSNLGLWISCRVSTLHNIIHSSILDSNCALYPVSINHLSEPQFSSTYSVLFFFESRFPIFSLLNPFLIDVFRCHYELFCE